MNSSVDSANFLNNNIIIIIIIIRAVVAIIVVTAVVLADYIRCGQSFSALKFIAGSS